MRNIHVLAILLFISLICGRAYGEEVPVKVKADNLKYDQEAGMITASGSVEIMFEGMKIRSDKARIDTASNVATAEGHVKIEQIDYNFLSSMLTYDMSSETAYVFNVKTVFFPKEIASNLYVSAKTITDYPKLKQGEYGSLTTCDYDDPHYHMEARWFDYWPEDKVVGYLVTIYGGPVPMLWTPYYVFNLKKRRSPYTIIWGQNDVEGKFVKTGFDYFINNDHYGVLHIDSTEKKGPGYGVDHEYRLNDANTGTLTLYTMDEQDTKLKDYVFKLNHTVQPDAFSKYTLIHNSLFIYDIPGRKYETSSSIGYNRSEESNQFNYSLFESDNKLSFDNSRSFFIDNRYGDESYTKFTWSESRKTLGQRTKTISDSFYNQQKMMSGDLTLTTNINYISYVTDEGQVADEKLEPVFDLTYKGSFYSMRLIESWYMDPDEDRYRGDDNISYMEKLPELTVSFNRVDLNYFTLGTTVGVARYHEAQYFSGYARMRHLTANRYMLGTDISRTDPLGFGTSLTTGLGLEQFSYDSGDQRYIFSQSAGLNTDLWGFFNNSANWKRAMVEGNTPFFTESLGAQQNYMNDTITLRYLDKARWNITGGYNYLNKTYDDLMTRLDLTPSQKLNLSFSTGWSIENQRYRDLVVAATLRPNPRFTNTASLQWDINVGKLLSANSEMDLRIGDRWEDNWHIRMTHSYDIANDLYTLRQLAIVKDLHCWEGYFTYDDFRKEYRFGMKLKAFPDYPLSYVAGQSGYYFDSFMSDMHFDQPSPRRY